MTDLMPTLWKTCRMLANPIRLACLREVLMRPGQNVGTLAHRLEIPEHHASMILRALQARGLIRPTRHSRWVYYHPQPDPLVRSAAPLLEALRTKLLNSKLDEASIIHILTAFTHPRRLAILAYLHENNDQSAANLSVQLGISQQALSRHLLKLIKRGLIMCDDDRYRLLSTSDVLARALLKELTEP